MKAIWNDEIIAESNETVVVEGNHYFSLSSVNEDFLTPSDTVFECPWERHGELLQLKCNRSRKPGRGMVLRESQRCG